MCLAYPGKVAKIEKNKAIVDFNGAKKEVNISLVDIKEGEYIIVHAGFAIQKLSDEEALDAIKIYDEYEKSFD